MSKPAFISQPMQIGVVVPDLYVAMENAKNLLGIENFDIKPFPPENCDDPKSKYYGEDENFEFILCTADWGGLQLEFLQPISGRNAYSDFLKDHPKGGVHHILLLTENHNETANYFEEKGVKEMLSGTGMVQGNGKSWKYYNTSPWLGFDLEIVNKVL